MINSTLLERMHVIKAAYDEYASFGVFTSTVATSVQSKTNRPVSWEDLLKDEDSSGDSSGGGGTTIKGLRGKDSVNAVQQAKATMKRLGRR